MYLSLFIDNSMRVKSAWLVAFGFYSAICVSGQPIYHPIGAAVTLGTVSNIRSLSSSLSNPASPYLMFDENEARDNPSGHFRFGLFGPGGIGVEVGDIDSLADELDGLESVLDDTSLTYAEALVAQAQYNAFLENAGEEGYAKISTAGYVPAFPILYKHPKYGTFAFDLILQGEAKMLVLDDELDIVVSGSDVTLETDSSVFAQTALASVFGIGYSNQVWRNQNGQIILGSKFNLTRMKLSRSISTIENLDEDDALEESDAFSNNYSIDLGAIWITQNTLFGIKATNLNEPVYYFETLGGGCGLKTGIEQVNCNVVAAFVSAGDIEHDSQYVAKRQLSLEGAISLASRQWSIQSSLDLNAVADAVEDDYQWFVISASHFGSSSWLPGFRAGYSKNLAGTKLDYLNMGFTLFQRANLDIGWALDTVEVDGTSMPRSIFVNLGLETAF